MNLLCLDIGNTSAHFGYWDGTCFTETGNLRTPHLTEELPRLWKHVQPDGISWCTVVPQANDQVESFLNEKQVPRFHLDSDHCPGLPISYPNPREIGQDRLANGIGAQELYGMPAVVIDMGTATTLDIVCPVEGYLGGVIAPGLAIMTRYLHEQTALLPSLNPEDLLVSGAIGRSTVEAMKLGCAIGFSGMIEALLQRVLAELHDRGQENIRVIATGGTAFYLLKERFPDIHYCANLTLHGLATAYQRAYST